VSPTVLAVVFLVVMAAAVVCFLRAYALRKHTPRHVRWAVAGVAIDLFGTVAVLVSHRGFDWTAPPYDATVATVHRLCAYVATALMLVQAVTGARRARIHRLLGLPFVILYVVTYALAVVAYAPR
jgi:heme A synthase